MSGVPPTGVSIPPGPQLRYEPLERVRCPRPVDRVSTIALACADKRVLDLGALDETAFRSKSGRGTWLHEEIARRAVEVVGVDASTLVPESEGLATAHNARIVRGDVMALGLTLERLRFRPDVVVAGELIEHLPDPLAFLRAVVATPQLAGARLVLSTPNATAFHNVAIALVSRESTHHDHLFVLSYKTLCTLFRRAGFTNFRLQPYYARFTEMKERNAGLRRSLVVAGEGVVNAIEWCFPMLSFGFLVEARISA